MSAPGKVGRTARLLGYAGLLPQAAAVTLIAGGSGDWPGYATTAAIGYAALILSFLGGIWWGFAMRREGGQASLAMIAVIPSLAAFGAILFAAFVVVVEPQSFDRGYSSADAVALVALGVAILATLPVDMRLELIGDAGAGWTRFRAVLSIGLATLTIAAGLLAEHVFRQEVVLF